MTYTKRGKPLAKSCKQCGDSFERPYKLTLAEWNKRGFCSQKCNGLSRVGKPMSGPSRSYSNKEKEEISKRMKGNQHAKGYRHTEETKNLMSINRSGPKHWSWKDDASSYSAFHKWLVNNFGPANKCENKYCNSGSSKFDYAKIESKTHSHKRENYIQLCRPCHRSYDTHGRIRFKL